MCKLKLKTRMAEYSVLQAVKTVFILKLHADLMVADLQSHFNMKRIYRIKLRRSDVSNFCYLLIQITDLKLVVSVCFLFRLPI